MILGSGLIQSADTWPQASDWLIRDEFTDTVAAGSVNGTAATPGPGNRAVTDTESKLSVGSGVMTISGGKASPSPSDPKLIFSATRAAGLAFVSNFTIDSFSFAAYIGWGRSTALRLEEDALWIRSTSLINLLTDASGLSTAIDTTLATATAYSVAIVLRSAGALYCIKGGIYTNWTLLYKTAVAATADLYAGINNYNCALHSDYIRLISLPAPFDTDDGLATDTHSGSVAAGTTFVHEGNHILEYAATVPSGDNVDVAIRMQDADNYWFCRVNSSGDISLLEVIDGDAPVQRSTAAGVVSTGHRVVIIADGTTIKGYSNNTLRWTYSSATNFATATAGKVLALGTGGAVSDLKTWPRTLSGTAAAILNKVSA